MVSSLSCVANTGLTGNQTADLFDTVCGLDPKACLGISANGTTGVYGAYSVCTASQQLSFAFNQYYLSQSKASTACAFGGNAKVQSASSSGSCGSLVSAAGAAGTGVVTAAPTAAGGSGTGSSGASTSSTSKAAAGVLTVPSVNTGLIGLGAYVLVAGMAGMGMVLF
jgi:uncharacterized membrane protein YuzA (DUF378 family)